MSTRCKGGVKAECHLVMLCHCQLVALHVYSTIFQSDNAINKTAASLSRLLSNLHPFQLYIYFIGRLGG